MLGFLFRGLTTARPQPEPLFALLTSEARRPGWFIAGGVPDTIDGRFAVLATVLAITLARVEREGEAGDRLSVALTERFIEVMESEHRELGLGDPTLGKTVRKLVAMLAKRTAIWRNVDGKWVEATRQSLYKGDVEPDRIEHSAEALRQLAQRLDRASLDALGEGRIA